MWLLIGYFICMVLQRIRKMRFHIIINNVSRAARNGTLFIFDSVFVITVMDLWPMKCHFHRETTVLLPWDDFINFCCVHLYTDTSIYDPWEVLLPLIRPFHLLSIISLLWKIFLFQSINMFSKSYSKSDAHIYKYIENMILFKITDYILRFDFLISILFNIHGREDDKDLRVTKQFWECLFCRVRAIITRHSNIMGILLHLSFFSYS